MLSKVSISAIYNDASGDPLSGQVEFLSIEPITDIESGVVVPAVPLTVGLNEGKLEVDLYTKTDGVIYNVTQTINSPFPVVTSFVIKVPGDIQKATLADLMTTKQQLAEIQKTAEEQLEEARATAFLKAVKDLQDFVAETTTALQNHVDSQVKLLTEDVNQIQEKADEAFTIKDPIGKILTPYEIRTSYAGTWPQAEALGMHNSDGNAHPGGLAYLSWGTGEPNASTKGYFYIRLDGSSQVDSKHRDHAYSKVDSEWVGVA